MYVLTRTGVVNETDGIPRPQAAGEKKKGRIPHTGTIKRGFENATTRYGGVVLLLHMIEIRHPLSCQPH